MSRWKVVSATVMLFCLACAGCEENESSPIVTNPAISGNLKQVDGCKSGFTKSAADNNQGCVKFTYDPVAETLTLLHVNAAFNCCPTAINVAVAVESGTIRLSESESGGMCDCECLFDLHILVENVPAKTFTIVVDEPLRNPQDLRIEFTVDLSEDTEGEHCVPRNFYPWGTLGKGT